MKMRALVLALSVLVCSAANASDGDMTAAGAELYLQQADQAVREGRLVQAGHMIEWLEQNSGAVSPDDVALVKAEYAIVTGDIAGAANSVDAIVDPSRNSCRQDTARGWVAANRSRLDPAILMLARAAKNCPDDAGIWNLLGLAFIRKGETGAGLEALGQALLIAPDNAELLNNHALALVQRGQLPLAMQQLDLAAKGSPDNYLIMANRDFVSGMMGHMPVRQAGENDAEWSNRLINTGKGAKAAQKVPESTALFSRALLLLDHFDETVWSATDANVKHKAQ